MKLLWHDAAWEEYLYWHTHDKQVAKRIHLLIIVFRFRVDDSNLKSSYSTTVFARQRYSIVIIFSALYLALESPLRTKRKTG